jgi:hypothetical protein
LQPSAGWRAIDEVHATNASSGPSHCAWGKPIRVIQLRNRA